MSHPRLQSFTADSALADHWLSELQRPGLPSDACVVLLDEPADTVLEWVRARAAQGTGGSRVIVLLRGAALAEPGIAMALRRAGAAEVLAHDTAAACETALARLRRWHAVDEALRACPLGDEIVGRSPAFVALLRDLVEVAAFTTASVLLLGESGTGKEKLAQLVHALDPRRNKGQLVTLDCTTVSPELAASEFFGHERGAFTGAHAGREGAFALADGGTLFLDEVGELPLPLQAQLLRIVQEGTYKRVGGNEWLSTRFRLVAATNRALAAEVERDRFRLDFFHRIATWTFQVPPLRDRPEDIVALARHFARKNAEAPVEIDERVEQFLIGRNYPGNVRELKQLMARICGRHVGPGPITLGDVPPADLGPITVACDQALGDAAARAALTGIGLKEIGRVAREAAIRKALESSDQNVQAASRLLRVTDRALQMDLAKREP
jgi:transcriptional regulator with GAF, ATPase, and Fis domain